jgi:hypothetical protein
MAMEDWGIGEEVAKSEIWALSAFRLIESSAFSAAISATTVSAKVKRLVIEVLAHENQAPEKDLSRVPGPDQAVSPAYDGKPK